jgi:hypothetical protein
MDMAEHGLDDPVAGRHCSLPVLEAAAHLFEMPIISYVDDFDGISRFTTACWKSSYRFLQLSMEL